jgi:hypothetical protein
MNKKNYGNSFMQWKVYVTLYIGQGKMYFFSSISEVKLSTWQVGDDGRIIILAAAMFQIKITVLICGESH